jgi:hypothetical protein
MAYTFQNLVDLLKCSILIKSVLPNALN